MVTLWYERYKNLKNKKMSLFKHQFNKNQE